MAKNIDAAAVNINMPAGTKKAADDTKIKAPEIIKAEIIIPFKEIMILALVAARAIRSSSVRSALRNMVSTAFEVPSSCDSVLLSSVLAFLSVLMRLIPSTVLAASFDFFFFLLGFLLKSHLHFDYSIVHNSNNS